MSFRRRSGSVNLTGETEDESVRVSAEERRGRVRGDEEGGGAGGVPKASSIRPVESVHGRSHPASETSYQVIRRI